MIGLLIAGPANAESFKQLVGNAKAAPMKQKQTVEVPFITWGGDVATFHANGGLNTANGSIYHKMNLKMSLRPGDDFIEQVRRYMAGESPFLRGTLRMIGQASEVIGSSPNTKGVVIMQLTWSAGDHIVSRSELKTLSDLKGAKVAVQRGGPHVGMLDDALRSARLSWDDIECGLGGRPDRSERPGSKDAQATRAIDACCVISPDMLGLTGGLDTHRLGCRRHA